MKNTGIVRRIDELGRIVIPKEIRGTLRLHVGTQMEIYTNTNGEIILKKHSAITDIYAIAESFCQALVGSVANSNILICDTSTVVAATNGAKKDYVNKPLTKDIESFIMGRKSYILNTNQKLTTYPIFEGDKSTYTGQIIVPIVASSDVVGAVVYISEKEDFSTTDVKMANIVATLLAASLE